MSQSVREEISQTIQTAVYNDAENIATNEVIGIIGRLLSGLEMEEWDLTPHQNMFIAGVSSGYNQAVHEFNTNLQTLKAQLQEEKE